ncbi:hypothetical protein [Glaciibacter superstes]|uniref:hypothetical protein n=1 Tax=Glaciibacter superstes TaxID=501023 RepID=UPI0003B70B90|nr:hypothetical protein [Glaciibacter superstes]
MVLEAFPTRVILMAEYGDLLPLWDRSSSPDVWFGPFERGVLGLSEGLETRLVQWNRRLDNIAATDRQWASADEKLEFMVDGQLLAAETQREFGAGVLLLYREDDSERSRATFPPRSGSPGVPNQKVRLAAKTPNGLVYLDQPSGRPSLEDQLAAMPQAEFDALAKDVDLTTLEWAPGQQPTRILLEPNPGGFPLRDRTDLAGRPSDEIDVDALNLPAELVVELTEWNRRWANNDQYQRSLQYLDEGHQLAARLQRALGVDVAVLFPEANPVRSRPTPEMARFVQRLRESRQSQ